MPDNLFAEPKPSPHLVGGPSDGAELPYLGPSDMRQHRICTGTPVRLHYVYDGPGRYVYEGPCEDASHGDPVRDEWSGCCCGHDCDED